MGDLEDASAGSVDAVIFMAFSDVRPVEHVHALLVYRPFALKDYVEVKGMEGLVEAIDLRYTTLRYEGQTILLPNSLLFTNPITIGKAQDK